MYLTREPAVAVGRHHTRERSSRLGEADWGCSMLDTLVAVPEVQQHPRGPT